MKMMLLHARTFFFVLLSAVLVPGVSAHASDSEHHSPVKLSTFIEKHTSSHAGKSGVYILEKGEESLLARAWLAENASRTIDVQYFIWSTDNIGVLAAEALLQAADRGVKIRVIVDDLLIDADDNSLVALATHPLIDIKIYNPKHSVGTSRIKRLLNVFTDFRNVNQRMHNKTFIVDGQVAITGGRNMADEYYDYDHEYNFRDRDVLLLGPVANSMKEDFEYYWANDLSVPVEELLFSRVAAMTDETRTSIYAGLHEYAQDQANFSPEVRLALRKLSGRFKALVGALKWDDITFISDQPGKNRGDKGLGGGGTTTTALINLVKRANQRITIQSPYLVMPEGGIELFKTLVSKGVQVRVSTNSLASTDNIHAFSGYSGQRSELLRTGIDIYEYRPDPAVQKKLIDRFNLSDKEPPIFSLHAKTLVVDSEYLFIGTFNLDPRSANLNTEAGVLIHNPELARQVERNIETDMLPDNSWRTAVDDPDSHASAVKRMRIRFWRLMPIDSLL